MPSTRPALLLFTLHLTNASVIADVKLPAIFSENMVLQKTGKVPVWGKAEPREDVTVTLDQQTATG